MSSSNVLVHQWKVAEEDFAANRYDGRAPSALEIIEATSRPWLILTAPHAVNHWRAGNLKIADRGTGGLVRVLSRTLGCLGIINAKQTYSDPSYDDQHALKDVLEHHIREDYLLVDLHGMVDQRDLDVEVGMGRRPSAKSQELADIVESALTAASLNVAHHEVYISPQPQSLTNWGLSRGVASIQVELAARVRPPLGSPRACKALLLALKNALATSASQKL
jgi:hypothetical protein